MSNQIASADVTITFVRIYDFPPLAGHQWRDTPNTALAGKQMIYDGWRGEVTRIRGDVGLIVTDTDGVIRVAINGLQGKLVTLTDDVGGIWYNLLVRRVTCGPHIPVVSGVGDLASIVGIITTEWELDPLALYY